MFWYGAHLVSQGKYDVTQMLTVFTLIIFSTTTAAQTMKLGISTGDKADNSPANFEIERSSEQSSRPRSTLNTNRRVHRRREISYQG